MALSRLESDTISRGLAAAREVLMGLQPTLQGLRVIYDGAGGVKETLTQDALDTIPSLSGLTKQQLDDGMYALTSVLLTDIETSYAQLAQLASRTSAIL
jgi:hypothetical protein